MLELKELEVAYGEVQAIWGIDLEVPEGKIITLVGSNGAGKSTTLRTISGLLTPMRGSITFLGEEIGGKKPHEIVARGIAHIPEARQLWPDMTVYENLELGAYSNHARAHRDKTIQWVFELFPRLAERRHQKAGTLSGGEQQMCAIGRGLMARPRLLMLDEPSLGLAPMLVEDVFRIVREINSEGVTILLVEQNIVNALSTADWAYVMETGKIIMEGPGRELLDDPHIRGAYLGV